MPVFCTPCNLCQGHVTIFLVILRGVRKTKYQVRDSAAKFTPDTSWNKCQKTDEGWLEQVAENCWNRREGIDCKECLTFVNFPPVVSKTFSWSSTTDDHLSIPSCLPPNVIIERFPFLHGCIGYTKPQFYTCSNSSAVSPRYPDLLFLSFNIFCFTTNHSCAPFDLIVVPPCSPVLLLDRDSCKKLGNRVSVDEERGSSSKSDTSRSN